MIFDLSPRLKRGVAAFLAVGVLGVGAAGGIAAANGAPSTPTVAPVPAAAKSQTASAPATQSTVPASVTRAETAAEDVITYLLEHGKSKTSPPSPALSRAEARTLQQLAHGKAAADLKRAGVSQSGIRAFQQRADRVAQLSLTAAPKLSVALAANHVSQLMPGFYGHYQDSVPTAVLRLDYLNREIHLRSMAGQHGRVSQLVQVEHAVWATLRPQLVAAGGANAARAYDAHLRAQKHDTRASSVQNQAVTGLDIVDLMETAFLAK